MLGSLCLATSCSPNGFDPQTIALFFDLVSEDVSISESAAEARDYFLHTFPALQLYSLQGLTDFCISHPDAVATLRSAELLRNAFSPGFYLAESSTGVGFSCLQRAVFGLIRGVATTPWPPPPEQPTNVDECALLWEIARDHVAANHALVANVGLCFSWLLEADAEVSRRAFGELSATKELGSLMLEQQDAIAKSETAAARTCACKAQAQLFGVCTTYLGTDSARTEALCEPDGCLIDACFSLLSEPNCREFAIGCISACMLPRPSSDSADKAKTSLFTRFATQFSSILDEHSEQPLQLVGLMLEGVMQVVEPRETRIVHQDMFRDAMCFLHIVTFWNTWDRCDDTDGMWRHATVKLVRTLTALIAGNDDSKAFFSDTIGYDQLQELLVRAGDVSDELLVAVLSMMFDGEAEADGHSKIQNADCVTMYVKLLFTREPSFAAAEVARLLTVLTRFSTNTQSCCDIGLLDLLIERLPGLRDADLQRQTLKLIEIVGGHSITAKQLRAFLRLMVRGQDRDSPLYSALLLETMHGMYIEAGAAHFFDFDGKESGLQVCDKVDRWPVRGYSFCAWIKVETFDCQLPLATYEPRLFSFLTKDGQGIEAFLRDGAVVLQILRAQSIHEATMTRDDDEALALDTGRWYHLAITHRAARALGQSEVSFFVDGKQTSPPSVLKYPDASGMACYIGTSAVQSVVTGGHRMIPAMPLCGQMSSVYFFDDALAGSQVQAIHSLGPNYMSSFEATDDPGIASEAGELTPAQQSLLDSRLSSQIWMSYNAKACVDVTVDVSQKLRTLGIERQAVDTTPERNGRAAGLNARLLGRTLATGTRSCVTRKLKDTLSAMGGVKLLFPLFAQLSRLCDSAVDTAEGATETVGHEPHHDQNEKTEPQLFLINLLILFQRALMNRTNLIFMARANGFEVIQWLLRQAPPESFCVETLSHVSDLGNSLPDGELQALSHRCLLLDFQLWINATTPVQKEAIRQLRRIRDANPPMFQQLCGVQGTLDILRKFYWFNPSEHAYTGSQFESTKRPVVRPSVDDLRSLRWQLIEIMQATFQDEHSDDDVQCVLHFLANADDGDQCIDIMAAMRSLCRTEPRLCDALRSAANEELLSAWLSHESEEVRSEAMQLVAALVLLDTDDQHHCILLREVASCVHAHGVTEATTTTLLRAALSSDDACATGARDSDQISNPAFMVVLFDCHQKCLEVATESNRALHWQRLGQLVEATVRYFASSIASCGQMCAVLGWQEVLLPILLMPGCPEEVAELLCRVFAEIHAHSFRHRPRGWQMLADSLAHLEAAGRTATQGLARRFCADVLQKVHVITSVSGVWKPEMRDSISHIVLLVEDAMFSSGAATDGTDPSASAAGHPDELAFDRSATSTSKIDLAEAAWPILQRPDLSFTEFGHTSEQASFLCDRPGGVARVAVRILVACIVESLLSRRVAGYLQRLHQYLGSLPPSTEQTNSIYVYTMAKLVFHGNEFGAQSKHKLAAARIVQQFVREFESVLEHSLPDPRICRATIADDEYKHANLPEQEYADYVPLAYLSADWTAQLEQSPYLQAERSQGGFRPAHAKQCSRFPGYDDDQNGHVAAYRERARNAANSAAETEAARLGQAFKREQAHSRSAQRSWKKLRRALADERSPWKHFEDEDAEGQFWKLDKAEGHQRKRTLLRRNYSGTRHEEASKHKKKGLETTDSGPDLTLKLKRQAPSIGIDDEDGTDDDVDDAEEEEEDSDVIAVPEAERQVFSSAAELIKPMRVTPGRFEISTTAIYFIPNPDDGDSAKHHKDRKWPLRSVPYIHPRRYLLRHTAIEVFLDDGTTYFLNFRDATLCGDVIKQLVALRQRHMVVVTRRTKSRLLKEATSKWKERRISNFEYIMLINTISGRTYNDICQYPVFPWVLTDYSSSTLDLDDKAVYRDLSKPMGALNPERLEYLVERAKMLEDPEIPSFLYGSHYSSGGATLFYLIRMEPFAKLGIELQGGQFDHADRMFHSVESAWNGAIKGNQDFKELVPEFFYMPEFLYNSNGFDLGTTQKGQTLGDVVLPPWAATAEDFVRINRMALESDFVSQDLHLWIDLIFGYKQTGPEAEAAHNVFYFLTYEGGVDIDAIDDPQLRKAREEQIVEYGQTPAKVFAKKHVKRNDDRTESDQAGSELVASFNADARQDPLVFVHSYADFIVTLSSGRRIGHHRWMPFPNFQGSPFTFELDRNAGSRTRVGVDFARDLDMMRSTCFAVAPDGKLVFSCGHWDGTFKCTSIETGHVVQVWAIRAPFDQSVVALFDFASVAERRPAQRHCNISVPRG